MWKNKQKVGKKRKKTQTKYPIFLKITKQHLFKKQYLLGTQASSGAN